MRTYLILVILLYRNIAISQESDFPSSWEGYWKGDLKIYSTNAPDTNPVQTIPMSLKIYQIDKNHWTWVLYYEVEGQQPRNYELIKDSTNNWSVDEENGIILKQQFAGG